MAIGEIPVAVLFFAHFVIRNLSGGRRVFTEVTQNDNLSGERRVLTDEVAFPTLHAGDDLHDEKKQGRAAVGNGDEKVRADAYGEQD